MNTLACKKMMNRSSLWWQKVQERLSMDSFSMFAMFAEKMQIIKTWKTTSRQTIWKAFRSPATSVRKYSGQENQRQITCHFPTGVNKIWHNMFWYRFSSYIFRTRRGLRKHQTKDHLAPSLGNVKYTWTKNTQPLFFEKAMPKRGPSLSWMAVIFRLQTKLV